MLRPQALFRLGYAQKPTPHSPRLSVERCLDSRIKYKKTLAACPLKERRKIYYREAGQLQRVLQKKAELCVKQFYPGQKARVDLLIYHALTKRFRFHLAAGPPWLIIKASFRKLVSS